MTDAERAATLIEGLRRLPAHVGLVFHGTPTPIEGSGAIATLGLTATSADPRVGTGNFGTAVVLAIVSRTGRLVAPFSDAPGQQEVVLLPGTVLVPVADLDGPGGVRVTVLDEVLVDGRAPDADATGLPADLGALVQAIGGAIDAALARPAVEVRDGRFTEPLAFEAR